jgi:hypothetical protein
MESPVPPITTVGQHPIPETAATTSHRFSARPFALALLMNLGAVLLPYLGGLRPFCLSWGSWRFRMPADKGLVVLGAALAWHGSTPGTHG